MGAERLTGGFLAGGMIRAEELTGFAASAYNRFDFDQHGISIGIVNIAHYLNGVQIGLINYAGNQRRGLKLLPIINAHFD
jgi:hypothetical protein